MIQLTISCIDKADLKMTQAELKAKEMELKAKSDMKDVAYTVKEKAEIAKNSIESGLKTARNNVEGKTIFLKMTIEFY